jgi:hypothetical protein
MTVSSFRSIPKKPNKLIYSKFQFQLDIPRLTQQAKKKIFPKKKSIM